MTAFLLALLIQSPDLQSTRTFVDLPDGSGESSSCEESSSSAAGLPPPSFRTRPGSRYGWTVEDGGLGWIGSFVAIGDSGRGAFAFYDLNHTGAALFPAFTVAPPLPYWEVLSDPSALNIPHGVDAAKLADLYAAITEVPDPAHPGSRHVDIRKYTRHGGEEWAIRYPHATMAAPLTSSSHIGVSDDGQTIVATALDTATSKTEVLVFDGVGVPRATFPVDGTIVWNFCLSADGKVAALGIDTRVVVLETETGRFRADFNLLFQLSGTGLSLSGDGSRLAFGLSSAVSRVRLLDWSGSQYGNPREVLSPIGGIYRTLEFSADGTALAAGIGRQYPSTLCRAELIDAKTGAIVTGETIHSSHGPNEYQNVVMDVAISADGSRFAAAFLGDEEVGTWFEEIRIYGRGKLIRKKNLPGSAMSIDMSPDGTVVFVGSKAVHANELGRGGRLDLIRVPR